MIITTDESKAVRLMALGRDLVKIKETFKQCDSLIQMAYFFQDERVLEKVHDLHANSATFLLNIEEEIKRLECVY